MIRINELELEVGHSEDDLINKISKILAIQRTGILHYNIIKKSIDARDKSRVKFSYKIDVKADNEDYVLKRLYNSNKKYKKKLKDSTGLKGFDLKSNVYKTEQMSYISDILSKEKIIKNISDIQNTFHSAGRLKYRPVIAGFGPAGIFCALILSRAGFSPLIIERGDEVDKRAVVVDDFWNGETVDTDSNVSFGEGGAGTFSDGKLNTMVKDYMGRSGAVLKTLVDFGADTDILYINNPHIGTDKLRGIIKNIRNEIIRLGGEFRFLTRLEKINFFENDLENNSKDVFKNLPYKKRLKSVTVSYEIPQEKKGQDKKRRYEEIDTDCLVAAIGHSARDTFKMLYENHVYIEQKPFAVGIRMAHKQDFISDSQYGSKYARLLPPASYKLTAKTSGNRGVYSFCMCPGGYIVNASTEKGMLAINGMSYHARDGEYANSAIIVTVNPQDFLSEHPLAGIEFQRKLEKKAYEAGEGMIPVQLLGDFLNKKSYMRGGIADFDCFRGRACFASVNEILPDFIYNAICEAVPIFERKIKGFGAKDVITAGIESRTSSPVRILRDKLCISSVKGLFPCGEGAGYAGGITSAAMDGIKVAESIIKDFYSIDNI